MKALIVEQHNHLVCQDVPEPEIGPEDVLVRVKAASICGNDVHGMDGSSGCRSPSDNIIRLIPPPRTTDNSISRVT
jgi:L-iditol 2-dehydrogenase